MSIDTKLQKLRETKEALRTVGEIDKNEPFSEYPAIFQEKMSSSGTNDDELIKLRTINNELNLAYLFFSYPSVFAGKIISANDLVQKVQSSAVNWCKNNNLKNIYNISNAFSGWNYGAKQYVNYDLDISHWSFSEIVDISSCFMNGFFRSIKLPNIKVSNISYAFSNTVNLIEIDGAIDVSEISDNLQYMIISCSKLEKIYIKNLNASGLKISESTNLKKEYLVYLLENAIASETTRTINLGSTNLAKLTAEEIAVGTNKGYTIS